MRAEVAVVTGASRGIGRAIALALGGEGAKARLSTAMFTDQHR
jgi:NAD(P)-dependent dehydrogenase (short-subunit alcohol dehydrogenase family)